jgi:microcystin degradation protein MlrC
MTSLVGRRIAVGGFMHETNTFQPVLTTYKDFAEAGDRAPLTRGAAVLTRFDGSNQSVAGSIAVLRAAGATLLPLVWASATPAGYVTRDAFERIAAMLIEDLRAALPLDGICLSLHGAMVAEDIEDAEGELLERIRAVVGPALPVVASLDLHSNTTPRMFALSDGLVGYCTYPHVDMAETGEKAARLLAEILVRGEKPHKAYHQLPYLIPLTWQCSTIEPSKSIYAEAARLIGTGVAATSFTPGFPAADIRDCGASVFVYGWDREAVERGAERLYRMVLDAEPDYAGRLWSPDEAVREAMQRTRSDARPVLLADTQDNPGVGGSSDTVGLLAAMLRNRAERAVLGLLHDPKAALAAHQSGLGADLTIGIGAGSGQWGEAPVRSTWRVERLGDGAMTCRGPMLNGWPLALGPMALLRSGGVSVVVSTKKFQPMDPEPFLHLDVEPAKQRIVALKSSVHFRAAFESMAQAVLVVESPGAMIVDPVNLPFTRLRPGLRMRPRGPEFPLAGRA